MNRTNIEWVKNPDGTPGYTWNPITGCLNHDNGLCKGGGFPCYAHRLANGRLKPLYLANDNIATTLTGSDLVELHRAYCDPFYPRFGEDRLEISHTRRFHRIAERQRYRDRGIFVCDMGDLFGIGIPTEWTEQALEQIKLCPNDRFYLLTKQPQNLIKFSPFPDNAWVGVTATNDDMFQEGLWQLQHIQATKVFISLEPFLAPIKDKMLWRSRLDWLIIGACTGTWLDMMNLQSKFQMGDTSVKQWGKKWTLQPKIEWVREIVEVADKAGVKVFLKDNLAAIEYNHKGFVKGRQEAPE